MGSTPDPRALGEDLRRSLDALDGNALATVAVGDTCRQPGEYAPAFTIARDAIGLVRRLGRAGTVVSVADLGPYALLLRASDPADLEAFARRALAPLVDHDARHGGELVATLRAYLAEDRVQRRAAARLSIHVNTVVYRLRRIEELLGTSLTRPDTVFDLTLAIRILDVLASPRGEGEVPQPLTR
jgi:DNA-binding PucR family transcriptional regulator